MWTIILCPISTNEFFVDILRITREKSWKEMFFQWKFPTLMKKKNWKKEKKKKQLIPTINS